MYTRSPDGTWYSRLSPDCLARQLAVGTVIHVQAVAASTLTEQQPTRC